MRGGSTILLNGAWQEMKGVLPKPSFVGTRQHGDRVPFMNELDYVGARDSSICSQLIATRCVVVMDGPPLYLQGG